MRPLTLWTDPAGLRRKRSPKGQMIGPAARPPGTRRHRRAIVPQAGKTGPIPRAPAGRKRAMTAKRGIFGGAVGVAIFGLVSSPAALQKSGGILRQYIIDSPASMSIHEETTVVAERPMMGVMNNLVIFDQHVAQNSLATVLPDLATDWAWDEDGTRLTFHLREGIKWHDGKPFTAADVKCTWDLLQGKTAEKLRLNPRKAWYTNLTEVVAKGDYEASFVLKRPQPAFLALLASGMSPV